MKRTQKIFYVCCTRAKEKLYVYYCEPSKDVIDKAKEWFGEENVKNIQNDIWNYNNRIWKCRRLCRKTKCLICGDIIELKYRHDLVEYKCDSCHIDDG